MTIDTFDPYVAAPELVFGLMNESEAEAARNRLANDPVFETEYHRWCEYAVDLNAVMAVHPPAKVWASIRQCLPANDNISWGMRILRDLPGWRTVSVIAFSSFAALLAVNFGWQAGPALKAPTQNIEAHSLLTARLAGETVKANVMVTQNKRRVSVALLARPANDRAFELWVVPSNGQPKSLGLLTYPSVTQTVASPAVAELLIPGVTLAISTEPVGGSPTGLPTGAVVASGALEDSVRS